MGLARKMSSRWRRDGCAIAARSASAPYQNEHAVSMLDVLCQLTFAGGECFRPMRGKNRIDTVNVVYAHHYAGTYGNIL